MPIEPVISLEQIIIIIAFLMILFALMWFVRRHRSGISSRIHPDRRMQHIEDLSLAPQQRLHLIEVDGRTFLVHAGKGHAASFIAVDGEELQTEYSGKVGITADVSEKLNVYGELGLISDDREFDTKDLSLSTKVGVTYRF